MHVQWGRGGGTRNCLSHFGQAGTWGDNTLCKDHNAKLPFWARLHPTPSLSQKAQTKLILPNHVRLHSYFLFFISNIRRQCPRYPGVYGATYQLHTAEPPGAAATDTACKCSRATRAGLSAHRASTITSTRRRDAENRSLPPLSPSQGPPPTPPLIARDITVPSPGEWQTLCVPPTGPPSSRSERSYDSSCMQRTSPQSSRTGGTTSRPTPLASWDTRWWTGYWRRARWRAGQRLSPWCRNCSKMKSSIMVRERERERETIHTRKNYNFSSVKKTKVNNNN